MTAFRYALRVSNNSSNKSEISELARLIEKRIETLDTMNLIRDSNRTLFEKISQLRDKIFSEENTVKSNQIALQNERVRNSEFIIRYSSFNDSFENETWGLLSKYFWFEAPKKMYEIPGSLLQDKESCESGLARVASLQKSLKINLRSGKWLPYKRKYRRLAKKQVLEIFQIYNSLSLSFENVVNHESSKLRYLEIDHDDLKSTFEYSLDSAAIEIDNDHLNLISSIRAPYLPWRQQGWDNWEPTNFEEIYVGDQVLIENKNIGVAGKLGANLHFPDTKSFLRNSVFTHSGTEIDRNIANEYVQNVLLRILASTVIGSSNFIIFDPIGMGKSVSALLDIQSFTDELIGPKIWSSQIDIESQLESITLLIEERIQKDLRSEFKDIFEYNLSADVQKEIKYLVIFDYGQGLTALSRERFLKILTSGERAGVFTYVVGSLNTSDEVYGLTFQQVIEKSSYIKTFTEDFEDVARNIKAEFKSESLGSLETSGIKDYFGSLRRFLAERPPLEIKFTEVLELFNKEISSGFRTEISPLSSYPDLNNSDTWWSADSSVEVGAPIGKRRKDETTIIRFDSEDHVGALLVGRPGSGKSTLMHTLIMGMTTLYSPEELSLYLIDFKQGVEFKIYAEEQLPHARCIAIETEREFGLSVLESISAEVARRSEVFKQQGGMVTKLETYRQVTGEKMPRIVLLFDEFQELFKINDQIGSRASSQLETIIRQGRFVGVHVILASQSLSGADALDSYVTQLLPIRILMQSMPSDAAKVLGDNNSAGMYLRTQGECIVNEVNGSEAAFNQNTKIAISNESERRVLLRKSKKLADDNRFSIKTRVFEGSAVIPISNSTSEEFVSEIRKTRAIRLRQGSPMSLDSAHDVPLNPETGGNVLVVVRGISDEESYGVQKNLPDALAFNAALSALVCGADVLVIDTSSVSSEVSEQLSTLSAHWSNFKLINRRDSRDKFKNIISDLKLQIERRINSEEKPSPLMVMFIGINRAPLDSDTYPADSTTEDLLWILKEGPDVKIHVWMWAESVSSLMRKIPPSSLKEFNNRIVGQCNYDDSQTLLDNDSAVNLRDNQLVIRNVERERIQRCISYSVAPSEWVFKVKETFQKIVGDGEK